MIRYLIPAFCSLLLAACASRPLTLAERCVNSTLPQLESQRVLGKFRLPAALGGTASVERTANPNSISDCNDALADQTLTPEQRRQMTIFLAESRLLDQNEPEAALAALDTADAVLARDRDYQEGLGVRADFLRALALYRLERKGEAVALANDIATARPFAHVLQLFRLSMALSAGAPDLEPVKALARLDDAGRPFTAWTAQLLGEADEAIAMLDAMAALGSPEKQKEYKVEAGLVALHAEREVEGSLFQSFLEQDRAIHGKSHFVMAEAGLAYKALLEGDAEESRNRLKALEGKSMSLPTLMIMAKYRKKQFEDSGRSDVSTVIDEFVVNRAYQAVTAKAASLVSDASSLRVLISELPRLIDGRKASSYSSQWAMWKKTGFSTRPSESPDSVIVEFSSNAATPKLQVDEMVLLRAAELAKEAGKSHFVIRDRISKIRTLTMTQYGAPIGSPRLHGFLTGLEISFVDPAGPGPLAAARSLMLSADEIIASLAPRYRD